MATTYTSHGLFCLGSIDTAYSGACTLILVPPGTSARAAAELKEQLLLAERQLKTEQRHFLARWRTSVKLKTTHLQHTISELRLRLDRGLPELDSQLLAEPEELLDEITPEIRDALFELHAEHGQELFHSAIKTLVDQIKKREADQMQYEADARQDIINKALGLPEN